MPTKPTSSKQVKHKFTCACDEDMRTACTGETFFREHEGRQYCVLHYPDQDKAEAFNIALQKKLEAQDFNFCGVWFPLGVSFNELHFDSTVDFSEATFSAPISFSRSVFGGSANFQAATFKGKANFCLARFCQMAEFDGAVFQTDATADFLETIFSDQVRFNSTIFMDEALFCHTSFNAFAHFIGATFHSIAQFSRAKFDQSGHFRKSIFRKQANFLHATFKVRADFDEAEFNADAYFEAVVFDAPSVFSNVKFSGNISFSEAKFIEDTSFNRANFDNTDNDDKEVKFTAAIFSKNADFRYATFHSRVLFCKGAFAGGADFSTATFNNYADFSAVAFSTYVRFAGAEDHPVFGNRSYLSLQHAQIEKPERVSFHTLTLRPHWFVNVDARKFEFVNVKLKPEILQDIKSLMEHLISAPHRLLDIAYRRLAVNAEENHHYRDAADFRYAAMDVRRLEKWRGMAFWRLAWWYWLLSGYGERITRAVACLLLILVLFAGLYTQVGFMAPADQTTKAAAMTTTPDTVGTPLHFTQALVYSFEVSILQKPEPKPLTLAARFLVGLETVLGPLQAALLALAIRRKFMR